jgi:hypothetical protein
MITHVLPIVASSGIGQIHTVAGDPQTTGPLSNLVRATPYRFVAGLCSLVLLADPFLLPFRPWSDAKHHEHVKCFLAKKKCSLSFLTITIIRFSCLIYN